MKKLSFILLFVVANFTFAQTNGINYKALLSDGGNVLQNQPVDVKFTLFDSSANPVYEETHSTVTDNNGIFSLQIGTGTVISGDFSSIDWQSSGISLKVEIDTGNGFEDFGTSALQFVPYAKYADTAGNVFSGDYNDLTNKPDFTGWDTDASDDFDGDFSSLQNIPAGLSDGDDDTHLTEAEVDAYVANNGYLTAEIDGDITNEIQNLQLVNDTLRITGANEVIFNGWDTNAGDDVHSLNDLSDAINDGTSVFVGTGAGYQITSDTLNNVGIGTRVMQEAITARKNVAIGYEALRDNAIGTRNIAIGDRAIYKNTKSYNTAVGFNALYENATGERNVALGKDAGHDNNGSGNVFLGHRAGYNETGNNKLYIANSDTTTPLIYGDFSTNRVKINGYLYIINSSRGNGKVLMSDSSGKGTWRFVALDDLNDAKVVNTSYFIGFRAGASNTLNGNNNLGVGREALNMVNTGDDNIAIGNYALKKSTGYRNVAIGVWALSNGTTTDGNVAVGYRAGYNTLGDNNVFLGNGAGYYESGSNKLYIDNSSTVYPLIYGDFSLNQLTVNGALEVTETVKVNQKLLGVDSGTADMKAYVYGKVTSSGTLVTEGSSGGFTVARTGDGVYEITFDTAMSDTDAYTIVATMGWGSGIGFIRARNYSTTVARVYTYNTSGDASNKPFSFVVYKK